MCLFELFDKNHCLGVIQFGSLYPFILFFSVISTLHNVTRGCRVWDETETGGRSLMWSE